MKTWFEIDNDGWKRMNAGRPPYELVKELIQNVLDEDFNSVNIDYNYRNGVFNLTIEDDIQGGIANSSLITTVFMTGKEDSCTKRGRKGRGLKEFLSVCKNAVVETVGKTVEFCENGSRLEYTNDRTVGTKISCVIIEEKWDSSAVSEINKFLSRIIIYSGIIFINGRAINKRNKIREIDKCYLTTQIIENGIQKDIDHNTMISVYNRVGKEGWIYEMGIPVCTTDIPYDVDIHQRIPLNDNRNEINIHYIRKVKEFVIKCLIDSLTKKDLLGWASEGINSWYNFSKDEYNKIVSLMLDGKSFDNILIKDGNRIINDKAKQKGFTLFDIKNLSDGLQTICRKVLKTTEEMIQSIENDCKPINVEPTIIEYGFINEHKQLVKNALGKNIEFKIMEKSIDLVTKRRTIATYNFENGNHIIRYNRLAIKGKIFSMPYSSEALDILIHELGHMDSDVHTHDFINAVTKYAGIIASYLYYKSSGIEKEEKKTLKDDIKDVLKVAGFDYLSLSEIYQKMGANTTNEKASIRSILNRECSINGIFVRHYDGAKYRLATNLLVD